MNYLATRTIDALIGAVALVVILESVQWALILNARRGR